MCLYIHVVNDRQTLVSGPSSFTSKARGGQWVKKEAMFFLAKCSAWNLLKVGTCSRLLGHESRLCSKRYTLKEIAALYVGVYL